MALRDRDGISGAGLIAGALVISAAIISWGQPGQPRYQLAASGDAIVRLDTDSGELIACNLQACRQVEQPDRAKTFGPLTVQFGDRRGEKDQQRLENATGN
jgi:hypothetical protein